MTLVVRPGYLWDTDALNYIDRVNAADAAAGQSGGLESGVADAIDAFVKGCKSDGIWYAIRASCILAGARTLSGALVPLAGTAPTNNNFVSGDYDRKTGLKGNGSTKSLGSNRNNNADPQNNRHATVYVSNIGVSGGFGNYIGGTTDGPGSTLILRSIGGALYPSSLDGTTFQAGLGSATGLIGMSRSSSSTYSFRANSSNQPIARNSSTPLDQPIGILSTPALYSGADASLAFYSIGESLDLAALDTRVTTLINQFGAVIP